MCALGVPCGGLEVLDPRMSGFSNNPCLGFASLSGTGATNQISDGYFWFHHTAGDTIDRVDPTQLNLIAASLAIWGASIANLPELLPRSGSTPDYPSGGGGSEAVSLPGKVGAAVAGVLLIGAAAAGFVYRRRVADLLAKRRAQGMIATSSSSSSGDVTQGSAYASLQAPLEAEQGLVTATI